MRETRDTPTANRGRALNLALWVLQVLLAIVFVMAGLSKLFGDPAMVEMFTTIGIGQWFRYVVGTIEILGAVGIVIPRLTSLAALGFVGRARREPVAHVRPAHSERAGRLGTPGTPS